MSKMPVLFGVLQNEHPETIQVPSVLDRELVVVPVGLSRRRQVLAHPKGVLVAALFVRRHCGILYQAGLKGVF